jgi:flavin reductase (DIM6/NTAB) family NADH-FMN oxidoreductase RutF
MLKASFRLWQNLKEESLLETQKVSVALSSAHMLLHPRNVVLVSCVDKLGKTNIITLAWSMPTSFDPPMLVISVSPRRYSHKLIRETGEFAVNIPTMDIVKEVLFCGRRTGRRHDKFKEACLTPMPAKMVKPPIIKECVAYLECKLHRKTTTGNHELFIGEVLAAYANEGVFNETFNIEKVKLLYHAGGDDFVTLASKIITPKLENGRRNRKLRD